MKSDTRLSIASTLMLDGTPHASFEFDRLPSINDYIRELGRHAVKGGQFEKQWRTLGHRTAEGWMADRKVALKACAREDGTTGVRAIQPVVLDNIVVLWKIWKGNRKQKDSAFNVLTKAVEDGFTDANLWPGDDDRFMRGRIALFCGVKDKPLIICEVHRVTHLIDGDAFGILPTLDVDAVSRILQETSSPDLKYTDKQDFDEAARAIVGEGESKLKRTTRRKQHGRP